MTEELFNKITEWQKVTFPNASALSKVLHLEEEVQELKKDLDFFGNVDNAVMEIADCLMLIYGAAATMGFSYDSINHFLEIKFNINQKRIWGAPDENGVVKHIV